jgi:hypothetical protein
MAVQKHERFTSRDTVPTNQELQLGRKQNTAERTVPTMFPESGTQMGG